MYKRQELVRAITQQKDMLLVAGCDISQVGKDAGEMCGIDAIGVIIEMDLGAVSYTHLDVYKRQPSFCPRLSDRSRSQACPAE